MHQNVLHPLRWREEKVARFLGAANTRHLNCRAWERQLLRTVSME